MDEVSEPIQPAELRDFLEADVAGDAAAPEFKARLRERLRQLLKDRTPRGQAASPTREPR